MNVRGNQTDWQIMCPKVRKRTAHLFDSGEWADCTFLFDTPATPRAGPSTSAGGIRAHKLILAMASPVFASQFYGSMARDDSILITDIDHGTFTQMLRYVYTDAKYISNVKEALDLYYAGKKYLLEHLQKFCIDYILFRLTPVNVCQVYEFACFHDELELQETCSKLFRKKTLDVLKSDDFLNAKTDTVKHILSSEYLAISDELELFDALLKYADNELKNSNPVENMANTVSTVHADHKSTTRSGRVINKGSSISSSTSDSGTATENQPSREEYIRNLLRPCVEKIRFLTLTPKQFAENTRLPVLLTSQEIMAVSMNIASKDTRVAMPTGFSSTLVPRGLLNVSNVAKINFTIKQFVMGKSYTSDVVSALNVPWLAVATLMEKRKASNEERETYVKLDVHCMLEKGEVWTVPAFYTIQFRYNPNDEITYVSFPKTEFRFSNTATFTSFSFVWKKQRNCPMHIEVCIEPIRPSKIPRPKTAFEIWRESALKSTKAENPHFTEAQVRETVKTASVLWSALLDKSEWEKKAALSMKKYREEKRRRRKQAYKLKDRYSRLR